MSKNLFQPGQSGNPAGRPKGARDKQISTHFLEELSKKVRDGEEERTKLELLIEQIVNDALKGKDKAREMVFDRTFGKAREYVDVNSTNEIVVINSLDYEEEEESNESDNLGGGEATS